MTLNGDVVSAIEKTLLTSLASEPIRRLALCLNTNEASLGNNEQNPLHFRKIDLEQIYIYRNGMPVADSPISTNGC